MSKNQLPKTQQQFVENMANPAVKNQTQAYQLAYDCSYNTARANAPRLLANACISQAIEHRKQRAIAHSRVTPEEVLGNAAFQMRSSIDDVLDDEGFFNIERARETGAADLIKKYKETIRTIHKEIGETEIIKTVEVELLPNQDARKEVANYIGLEKFAPPPPDVEHYVTITRSVAEKNGVSLEEVFKILVKNNSYPEGIVKAVGQQLLGDGKSVTELAVANSF